MLKTTIEKLEDVSEKYRAHYTKSGDSFILDSELQGEDVTALINAKQHEKDATTKAKAELVTARAQAKADKEAWEIKKAELEGRTADADKLRQDALDRQKADFQVQSKADLADRDKTIHDLTAGALLNEVANDVYSNPKRTNLDHIKARIKVGDDHKAFIQDANGATMSTADYIAELKNEAGMEKFLRAGSGSGGGTRRGGNNNSNSGNKNDDFKRLLMQNDPTLE